MRTKALAAIVVAALALGGCTSTRSPSRPAGGGQPATATGPSCLAGATPSPSPAGSLPAASGGSRSAGGGTLPDLTLPCLAGGHRERVADLRGPAVINLWASWCGPCREELPAINDYAQRAAGRVRVIGVVTDDPDRPAALSLVDDLGLRFPMLYDKDAEFRRTVAGTGIPRTLLLDEQGRIAYKYLGKPLDEPALADLVQTYLGSPPP